MEHRRHQGAALALGALLIVGALASSAFAQTERTVTELGQRVPSSAFAEAERTATELGQRVPAGESVSTVLLRRDSSQAEPLIANVGPTPYASPYASADVFDWGDAAIGAGIALVLGAAGLGGVFLLGRRRADRAAEFPVAAG